VPQQLAEAVVQVMFMVYIDSIRLSCAIYRQHNIMFVQYRTALMMPNRYDFCETCMCHLQ